MSVKIENGAKVKGNARILDSGWLRGRVVVQDNAVVGGAAYVCDNSKVGGNARVEGHAWLQYNSIVRGHAHVDGKACPCANTILEGDVTISSGLIRDVHWWRDVP